MNNIVKSDRSVRSLVRLNNESHEMINELLESEGEINNNLESKMSELETQTKEHVDLLYQVYVNAIPSRSEEVRNQIQSLARVLEQLTKFEGRVRSILIETAKSKNLKYLIGDNYKFTVTNKNKFKFDESKIPKEYFKEIISLQLDKTKLREDLEKGINVEGVSTEEYSMIRPSM